VPQLALTILLPAAVARLQTIVKGMAAAALPDGRWREHLADTKGGAATDVCDTGRGRPAGSKDGFSVDVHLPADAMQIVGEGTTPCVR
jgi:hypothetical protein